MNILFPIVALFLSQAAPAALPTAAPEDEFEVEEVAAEVVTELPQPVALLTRGLALPNATLAPAGTFQFSIDHRARAPVNDRDYWYQNLGEDFLGLDRGGFKIGLSLRYSLKDWLDVSVLRVNGTMEEFDTYEFISRVRLLSKENAGFNLVAGAGLDWFQQPIVEDAVAGLVTLALDTKEFYGVEAGEVMMMSFDSSGPNKSNLDDPMSVAIGGHLRYSFTPGVSAQVEGAFTAMGYAESHSYLAAGMSFRTVGHIFTLLLTNTQYLTVDALTTGAYMPTDKPMLGFTIVRDWALF
jgi:hypothetical protein